MENNNLIFGKSGHKKIVGLEVNDSEAEVFTQDDTGTITSTIIPNKYWLLSNTKINSSFSRLEGELHYKYGRQYSVRSDWSKDRSFYKNVNEDVYSIWNEKEALQTKDGICYYQDLEPTDISVLSFDLETTGLNPEAKDARVILISNTFRSKNTKVKKLFSYDEYETEALILEAWSNWVREMDPSILCGHNIFSFDLNYLIKRSQITRAKMLLGRDNTELVQNNKPNDFRIDGSRDMEYNNVTCYGRELIDTMFLAYRYDGVEKKYDSYSLKVIIKQEGLEKEGRTFYDASQIRFNYTKPEELVKIKEYCIDDSDDGLALFDLMCPAYFYLCQTSPRSFQHLHQSAPGALINGMLVRSYLQEGHSIPKADKLEKLEGGISFAIPGVYRYVYKVDLKSAYPSQILRFKLFDEKKDPKGNFYNLVKYFAEQRFYYKKMFKETLAKKWKDLDAAAKVFINSAYGACSTNGLNFNSNPVAAKITLETRNVIDMALKWASGHGKDFWVNLFKEITGGEELEDEAG